MTREIKFRAWDEHTKAMTHFTFNDIHDGKIGVAFNDPILSEDWEADGEMTKLKHLDVCQYTGLKDKNGKEIYEGDICSGHSDGAGKIVWNDFEYVYQFDSEDIIGIWEVRPDLEIIGNIYENPELLQTLGEK